MRLALEAMTGRDRFRRDRMVDSAGSTSASSTSATHGHRLRPCPSYGGDIRITELAASLGATPRALRYYEEIGLIRPQRTTAGVRTYGPECRRRLELIVALRRAGASLEQITGVLSSKPDNDQGLRQEVHSALQERLVELHAQAEQVEALLVQFS